MVEKNNQKETVVNQTLSSKKKFCSCNRPKHSKGRIPTKAELEYRRLRPGD